MEIDYTDDAKEDLLFWKRSGNKAIQKKINQLLVAIQENPFFRNRKTRCFKTRIVWKME